MSYEELPLSPEKNPPENLEDLELLISRLQEKSDNMRLQLENIVIREKEGLFVDYKKVKKLMYARSRTNRSVAALQRTAKQKRKQLNDNSEYKFEQLFMLVAKEELSLDQYSHILDITRDRYKQSSSTISDS